MPTAQPAIDLLGGNQQDFLNYGVNRSYYQQIPVSQYGNNNLASYLAPLTGYSGPASQYGLATLTQILSQQGKTDPAAFNQLLAGIGRDTNTASTAVEGSLARSGMQRSGVGAALQGAVQAGGAERLAGARANEAQIAEERKRQDLRLLLEMIVNPTIDIYGISQGNRIADQQSRRQQQAAQYGAYGDLLGQILNLDFSGKPKQPTQEPKK